MSRENVKAYYRSLWGRPSRVATFRLWGHEIDVLKWNADRNPQEVNIYATAGSSAHPPPGSGGRDDHRIEYFVGLSPAQDAVARSLAMLAIETIANGMELGDGHSVLFPEPLWPGTQMRGFLIAQPVSEVVPVLRLVGGPHVEFLQAIPVFPSEVAFKAANSFQDLMRRWEAAAVRLWDPGRTPEP